MHTRTIFPLLLGALAFTTWATPVQAEDKAAAGSEAAATLPGGGPEYGMGPGITCSGPGMMGGGWGMGPWSRADLTADQRTEINKIRDETRRKNWELMGRMMDEQARLRDLYDVPKRDGDALSEAYRKVRGLKQQIYEVSEDAYDRIDAILTPKQKEKSSWRFWRHW
ncbi:Spy/CpxP family protein refolding chaperone [Thiobacillus denitrificans]|uniref:Spy/CpxP family protein refolding chaperone n=1 Tax=Thiobacillus denitrificans TaxID=36861 RepID=UPI0003604FF8|nr:Spy/CpxP family protein refolding chaperone [Thiobacillus denitrificans]